MSKISRDTVITEALELLDEVGLDAVSTRQLAKRLGIEQPSLYWHFHRKEDLLHSMAKAAMRPHATAPLPSPPDDWREWFLENTRSFRRTLLARRDGARLHAGLIPDDDDLQRVAHKMAFLIASGLPEPEARMAMLAASRFTVGGVLEQQADAHSDKAVGVPHIDHNHAFEAGLSLILDGLTSRVAAADRMEPNPQ